METYFSNGKLLITGEYVVLDGAVALAVPTTVGQSLTVETISEEKILWKSLDEKGQIWFEDELFITSDGSLRSNKKTDESSIRLIQILEKSKTTKSTIFKFQPRS